MTRSSLPPDHAFARRSVLKGAGLVVGAGLLAATVVYLAACTVLRIPEAKSVAETASRIFGRKRG